MVVVGPARKKPEPILSNLFDLGLRIQGECFAFLDPAHFGGYFMLHVLVRVPVLNLLVFLSKSEFLQGGNLVRDLVVLHGTDRSAQLGMVRLQQGSVQHILCVPFRELLLEEDATCLLTLIEVLGHLNLGPS